MCGSRVADIEVRGGHSTMQLTRDTYVRGTGPIRARPSSELGPRRLCCSPLSCPASSSHLTLSCPWRALGHCASEDVRNVLQYSCNALYRSCNVLIYVMRSIDGNGSRMGVIRSIRHFCHRNCNRALRPVVPFAVNSPLPVIAHSARPRLPPHPILSHPRPLRHTRRLHPHPLRRALSLVLPATDAARLHHRVCQVRQKSS